MERNPCAPTAALPGNAALPFEVYRPPFDPPSYAKRMGQLQVCSIVNPDGSAVKCFLRIVEYNFPLNRSALQLGRSERMPAVLVRAVLAGAAGFFWCCT
jgi:hypothetical protein